MSMEDTLNNKKRERVSIHEYMYINIFNDFKKELFNEHVD